MKIGIEGIPFFGDRSGIGQFSKRLVEHMAELDESPSLEIIRPLMPHRKLAELPIPENKKLSYRIVRWSPPIIYYQLFKRTGYAPPYDLVALRKYDALVFFNFVAFPVRKKVPSILFIHDLSHVHYPEHTSPKNLVWLNKFVPRSIKRADKIVTISESSRNDIARFYGVPKKDIALVYPALDHNEYKPRTSKEVTCVKKKYKITKPYILSVCTLEPRKNLLGVLKAFEMLPEELKQKYALVLVGGKGWLDGEIHDRFEALSKKYTIIKTGYADDADLPPLYSGAELFVYPAFYEGFGMPPLEALACGAPVITADNSSLPEAVGNAAITVKAADTEALSANMIKVLEDKKLQEKLRQAGFKHAAKFSWEKSAKDMIEVINSVVKK